MLVRVQLLLPLLSRKKSTRSVLRHMLNPQKQKTSRRGRGTAQHFNPYKLTGPDGLGPRILKETAEVISEPLTNIFNQSLETGIVPDDSKRANVTPLFKKGNKQIANNYRPISLTSVISKTIERLLKVRITKHLNDQNLINDTQHGFREKRSCLTNLLDFFGEDNRIYDSTKAVDLVYLDFQKAFDKVHHERLMAKGEAHGIRGNYSRWIRNWLTGGTQRVVIHDETSDPALVTSRVPQGSVLARSSSSSISTILMSESSVKSTNSPMTRNSVTEHSPKGTKQLSNQTSIVFYNRLTPGK
ncbi:Reverse transcriptase domain [Trinorchestia longiramus]|nr:Reverse transcriptase domain [Trinorchestia longiramus]